MIPDNLSIMVAVISMAVATLLAAGVVSTYQRHQQYRRQRLQSLIQGAQRNERLLEQLGGVSLPRAIRIVLRQDIQDRYRAVARLHSGYPGIDTLQSQAQQRLGSEPGDGGGQLPVAPDDQVFGQWQAGIQELLTLMQSNGTLRPLAPAQRHDYQLQLLELLAECLYGHYMNQADKLKQEGRYMTARNRIQHVQELLRGLGLQNERVQQLLSEAEAAYRYLLDGVLQQAAAGS